MHNFLTPTYKSFVALALIATLSFLSSCSLMKIKLEQPVEPLSKQEINLRYHVHDFRKSFSRAVISTADSITESAVTKDQQINAILWKIGANTAINEAAYQQIPLTSLIETWALCVQMEQLMDHEGSQFFGDQAPYAWQTSNMLTKEIEELSESLLPTKDYVAARDFVLAYTDTVRIENLGFNRLPVNRAWNRYQNIPDSLTYTTTGSLPQVMSNTSDQLTIMSEQIPNQLQWQLDLFNSDFELDSMEVIRYLGEMTYSINQLTKIVEDPQVVDSLVSVIRADMEPLLYQAGIKWDQTLYQLTQERMALTESIQNQSEVMLVRIDSLSVRLVDRTFDKAAETIPKVLNSLSLLIIVLAVVLFGIPLGIGIWIGRLTKKKG